jgi:hypothetical protein
MVEVKTMEIVAGTWGARQINIEYIGKFLPFLSI